MLRSRRHAAARRSLQRGKPATVAVHVGDNQLADVGGARNAGLTAVWVDRHGGDAASDPHHVVPDLRGLVPLL
ncbi:HAD family hydrolase [Microbacterium sp. HJ5]